MKTPITPAAIVELRHYMYLIKQLFHCVLRVLPCFTQKRLTCLPPRSIVLTINVNLSRCLGVIHDLAAVYHPVLTCYLYILPCLTYCMQCLIVVCLSMFAIGCTAIEQIIKGVTLFMSRSVNQEVSEYNYTNKQTNKHTHTHTHTHMYIIWFNAAHSSLLHCN